MCRVLKLKPVRIEAYRQIQIRIVIQIHGHLQVKMYPLNVVVVCPACSHFAAHADVIVGPTCSHFLAYADVIVGSACSHFVVHADVIAGTVRRHTVTENVCSGPGAIAITTGVISEIFNFVSAVLVRNLVIRKHFMIFQ